MAQRLHGLSPPFEISIDEGRRHGLFNYGKSGNQLYDATAKEMHAFLVSLGVGEAEDIIAIGCSRAPSSHPTVQKLEPRNLLPLLLQSNRTRRVPHE